MKAKRMLLIYLLCVFPVISICVFMILSGSVSVFYSGFAVDSSGILYVGTDREIKKYSDGKAVGTISPQTARGYAFTIQNDDTILLSTASTVYELDLSGNVLSQRKDEGTKEFNRLQKSKNRFTAQDGQTYVMKTKWGRTVICSDDAVLYQMPTTDYIVRIAFLMSVLSVFVFVPIIVYRWRSPKRPK